VGRACLICIIRPRLLLRVRKLEMKEDDVMGDGRGLMAMTPLDVMSFLNIR
jgi:hypothetical protein